MLYFSQMVGLALHNFTSAASGIAVAAALVRGVSKNSSQTIGNFWADLTRIILYVLLPICVIYSIFLVSQGMIDNFKPYETVQVVNPYTAQVVKKDVDGQEIKESARQPRDRGKKSRNATMVQGPMASQVAIPW